MNGFEEHMNKLNAELAELRSTPTNKSKPAPQNSFMRTIDDTKLIELNKFMYIPEALASRNFQPPGHQQVLNTMGPPLVSKRRAKVVKLAPAQNKK